MMRTPESQAESGVKSTGRRQKKMEVYFGNHPFFFFFFSVAKRFRGIAAFPFMGN